MTYLTRTLIFQTRHDLFCLSCAVEPSVLWRDAPPPSHGITVAASHRARTLSPLKPHAIDCVDNIC